MLSVIVHRLYRSRLLSCGMGMTVLYAGPSMVMVASVVFVLLKIEVFFAKGEDDGISRNLTRRRKNKNHVSHLARSFEGII